MVLPLQRTKELWDKLEVRERPRLTLKILEEKRKVREGNSYDFSSMGY